MAKFGFAKIAPTCGPTEALVSTDAAVWQRKGELSGYMPGEPTACTMQCDRWRNQSQAQHRFRRCHQSLQYALSHLHRHHPRHGLRLQSAHGLLRQGLCHAEPPGSQADGPTIRRGADRPGRPARDHRAGPTAWPETAHLDQRRETGRRGVLPRALPRGRSDARGLRRPQSGHLRAPARRPQRLRKEAERS